MNEIQWTDEKVARLWGYYAKNPAYQNQYFSFHSGKFILDYVGRYIKFSEMQSILDFGCGPGYLLEHLINLGGGKCYGLDFSKESIETVNMKLDNKPGFGYAIHVDKLPSPLGDNSMDFVISVEVVEHLNDEYLSGMIKEISRVLKPGGYVGITTPNKEDLEVSKTICPECGCIFHRWQHVRTWNANTLSSKMEDIGFKTIHCSETYFTSNLRRTVSNLKSLLYINKGAMKKSLNLPHLIYIGRR